MSKTLIDYPELLKEWHSTKNGDLEPSHVPFSSNKKFWWKCPVADDHEWTASANGRTRINGNRGCPYCAGRKIAESNSLQLLCPKIAKEWHPIKNGELTPLQVGFSVHKQVLWLGICGHEWEATINHRTNMKSGCPYCRGLKVNYANCLATIYPEIAKDWHSTKNGELTSLQVSATSGKKVWWQCEKGHEWRARIADRAWGKNCPICNESKGEKKE